MTSKCNITVEFNNFSNLEHEALTDPKPQWTYAASLDFVVQVLTTIGTEGKTENELVSIS